MRITVFIPFLFLLCGIIAAQSTDSSIQVDTSRAIVTKKVIVTTDTLTTPNTQDTLSFSASPVTDSLPGSEETTTDTTATAPFEQKAQGPIIEEFEEELILDGGEESILAPVASEPPPQTLPLPVDSAITQQGSDTTTDSTESIQQQHKKILSHYPSKGETKKDEPDKPLTIEQTKSINFARNFKEYRSPKIAILLSLLVPGAGQAYSHHALKAGIFAAVEVAFITAGVLVTYNGNKRTKKARSFADDHYSMDSLQIYQDLLIKNDFDSVFYNFMEYADFKKESSKKSQTYYNLISHQVSPYVQGWKDVTPRFDNNFDPVNMSDNGSYISHEHPDSLYLVHFVDNDGNIDTVAQYGISKDQQEFNSLLSKANSYFRWSKGLFSMLLINHIVSAVDAGITAKAYNDQLLGKTSLWQKINIRNKSVSTFSGSAQGYALEVRF